MDMASLSETAQTLITPGKGILAADESPLPSSVASTRLE